jgi:hypothetical protein
LLWALEVFFQKILENPIVQAQIRNKTFQLPILILQGLQPHGVTDSHAAVLVLPVIKRLLGYPVFTTNIDVLDAQLRFFDNPNDLFRQKSLPFHPFVLPYVVFFYQEGLNLKMDQFLGGRSDLLNLAAGNYSLRDEINTGPNLCFPQNPPPFFLTFL